MNQVVQGIVVGVLLGVVVVVGFGVVLWRTMKSITSKRYQVKLVNGDTFIAHKTASDVWNDLPWLRYYTVEEASWGCSRGAKIIVPRSKEVYIVITK